MRLAFARRLYPIINRGPSRDKSALQAGKSQRPSPRIVHPPERHHLRPAHARHLRESLAAQPFRPLMRAGRVERRYKDKIRPCAPCRTRLAPAMRGHGQIQAKTQGLRSLPLFLLAKMDTIRTPAHRLRGRTGEHDRQLPYLGDPHQPSQKSPAHSGRQMVVADHNPAAGRKPCNDSKQGAVQPLIGEQPACRQDRGVASRHGPFYRPVANRCNARE